MSDISFLDVTTESFSELFSMKSKKISNDQEKHHILISVYLFIHTNELQAYLCTENKSALICNNNFPEVIQEER